jgi:hypothetical protein
LWWLKKTDSMARNPKWMAKSLVKLKVLAESEPATKQGR